MITKTVQDAMKRYYDYCNEAPSYYMWRILDQGREPLRRNLARVAGCDPEELAIQRNASEALEAVIFGLQLKPGDEVVLTHQDYPNMINAWKQREKREGIKLVWIDLELPSGDLIPIEERKPEEVTHHGGTLLAPVGVGVANPAFDVTPNRYVAAIITDVGVVYPPFEVNLPKAVQAATAH